MLIHIVERTGPYGELDEKRVIAKVRFEDGNVSIFLERIYENQYKQRLEEYFLKPNFRFTSGGIRHGTHYDCGETILPGDPKILEIAEADLKCWKLGYVVARE